MIHVETLVFNAFQENTYLVYDDTLECVIIDPGCQDIYEQQELVDFIQKKKLKPVKQLYTHCHIDHILGNAFVFKKYGLRPIMHRRSLPFFKNAGVQSRMFGLDEIEIIEPEEFFDEGYKIKFGDSSLEVLYTPGHIDGHVCFTDKNSKFVIVGDVLFRESIGRTDLPSGDFDLLISSITEKLYCLGADFTVYPGHGEKTTIGHEIRFNPFIRL
jgi:glyoxylase-like metal-dependent hydrolase (beta-lactamase superfamily II)